MEFKQFGATIRQQFRTRRAEVHVVLEPHTARGLALKPEATHFVVVEAKLRSALARGTRNAREYGQAARNVACMAEAMALAPSPASPERMTALGFYVVAPQEQIAKVRIDEALSRAAIRLAVEDRAGGYSDRAYLEWFSTWFEPMLGQMRIESIAWEDVVKTIACTDADDGAAFDTFYQRCLHHNGLGERSEPRRGGGSLRDEARLAAHVQTLDDFEFVDDLAIPYNHMGATITDAVLQAGLRYQTVVWPRVQHVMESFPEAATTSGFLRVLRERGGEEVVRWTHHEKLGRMEAVAELFIAEGVETEGDLRRWLCGDKAAEGSEEGDVDAACRANVAKLAAVRGMGPKTIDYFKILCGEDGTAAIDVHLMRFLERASVKVRDYDHARQVVADAAPLLGVSAARLDHSIWTYMSKAGRTW